MKVKIVKESNHINSNKREITLKLLAPCLALLILTTPAVADKAGGQLLEPIDVELMVERILLERSELVLQVLADNPVLLANLVDRANNIRSTRAQEALWLSEMENPKVPVIDTARPVRGNDQAPVTIVEYSDFECPYCQAASATLHEILADYGSSVRLVYKHNPLTFHASAEPAARYFEAISLQSEEQAWIFHDRLFEEQQRLEEGSDVLERIAALLPIDQTRLVRDLDSELVARRIQADKEEAQAFGFDGTPAFVINGVSVVGNQSRQTFDEIIDLVIQKSAAAVR
ncbi:MAG: DsbA family protein [Granulosicoccus sp.]